MENLYSIPFSDMETENNVVIKGTDENEEIEPKEYQFNTMGGDFQIRQLIDQMCDEDISLPKIQRNYVWNSNMASKFIESVLMDLPLPSIFLAKDNNERLLIVDGLQRLTTLKKFCKMEPDSNGKIFKISNSKSINEKWRGKQYNQLLEVEQRRIRSKLMHAIIIIPKNETELDGLYTVFQRINSGGMQLNPQEIRNAIHQSYLNDKLFELNDYIVWRNIFGSTDPNCRMKDIELILRFLALTNEYSPNEEGGSVSFVALLNNYMKTKKHCSVIDIDNEANRFKNTIDYINQNFNNSIFRSTNGKNDTTSKKFYVTIFDPIMFACNYAIEHNLTLLKNSNENLFSLLEDESFKKYMNSHTTEKKSISTRIKLTLKYLFGVNN